MVYRLQYTQILPVDVNTAWDFFSQPANLCRITPDWLCFDIRFAPDEKMYPGMIIEYVIRAVAGIPMRWLTEITQVQKPYFFVDEQRLGPYRFWHHQHLLKVAQGGVEVTDLVHYSLYLGPLASPLHVLLVRPRLEEIFTFRRKALTEIFG